MSRIESERQYEVTLEQIGKFEDALRHVDEPSNHVEIHPVLVEAAREGMESMLQELREEAEDWKRRAECRCSA